MPNKNIKIIGLLKKDVSKVVNPKKFVILYKVIISEDISSNIQKSHTIIQAYNVKEKNFILTQLLTKLLYSIPEASNIYFVIYYPHYKKKLKTTKFAYNPFLFYSNKPVDNSTWTFFYTA